MHGRLHAVHRMKLGARQVRGPFGLDVEKMSPRGKIVAALMVLGLVALSGVFLALTPVWWIFTTYFWVAFPALGLLGSGIAGLREGGVGRVSEEIRERELLETLRDHGEVTPAGVAAETSLTVAEADRRLRALAEGGHLEVKARGGGIFYALWEAEGRIAGVK